MVGQRCIQSCTVERHRLCKACKNQHRTRSQRLHKQGHFWRNFLPLFRVRGDQHFGKIPSHRIQHRRHDLWRHRQTRQFVYGVQWRRLWCWCQWLQQCVQHRGCWCWRRRCSQRDGSRIHIHSTRLCWRCYHGLQARKHSPNQSLRHHWRRISHLLWRRSIRRAQLWHIYNNNKRRWKDSHRRHRFQI